MPNQDGNGAMQRQVLAHKLEPKHLLGHTAPLHLAARIQERHLQAVAELRKFTRGKCIPIIHIPRFVIREGARGVGREINRPYISLLDGAYLLRME